MERAEAIVIGAGVVGLAIAAKLAESGVEVIVLEQHELIGSETSSRTSEVTWLGAWRFGCGMKRSSGARFRLSASKFHFPPTG